MNGKISKTIAVILASALLAAAASGCAGNNGGSDQKSEASGQSTISVTDSNTESSAQDAQSTPESAPRSSADVSAQSVPQESSQTASQPAPPQSSDEGAVVCDPSFLGTMSQVTKESIDSVYLGTDGGAKSLILVNFKTGTAVLLAGPTGSNAYEAAIFGQIKKESDMDTYDANGFGAVYSITDASERKQTFSITGTKTGEGSDKVTIRVNGLDDMYSCQEGVAEEGASVLRLYSQNYSGEGQTEQSQPAAPLYPASFKELAAVEEKDITFAISGETASGAELFYVEIADGTEHGKAFVIGAKDGLWITSGRYDVGVYGSCSGLVSSVTEGRSTASLNVTDSSGSSVSISVTQADEPGMFYASVSGFDDQFIMESMEAEYALTLLHDFAYIASVDPSALGGGYEESDYGDDESGDFDGEDDDDPDDEL